MESKSEKLDYKSLWTSFIGGLTIGLKRQKAWRIQLITWLLADAIRIAVMAVLLSLAAKSGDLQASNIVMYYSLLIILVRLTTDFTYENLSREIVFGAFSNYLLRPGHYLAFGLGESLSARIYGLFITIPFIIGIAILYQLGYADFIEFSWQNIVIGALFMPIAFLINFIRGNTYALVAFHVKQIFGLTALYRNLIMILGGEFLPLQIFPTVFFVATTILPFRYGISFPLEVFMGWLTVNEIIIGGIFAILWLFIFILMYIWLYKKSVLKFEAEGL